MIILTTHMLAAIPPLLTGAGGPLHTPVLGLFASNLIPGFGDLLARYTASGALPTYTGYATITPTFATAYQDTDGSLVLQTNLNEFVSPSDNSGQSLYGYYLTDGGSPANLLAAEVFPATFQQSVAPQALVFVATIAFRPLNNNGSCVQLSY
jgi:hypothetical protein